MSLIDVTGTGGSRADCEVCGLFTRFRLVGVGAPIPICCIGCGRAWPRVQALTARVAELEGCAALLRCPCAQDYQDECCPRHGRFATLQEAWEGGVKHERGMTAPDISKLVEDLDHATDRVAELERLLEPDELATLAARIAKGRAKYANGCTVLSLLDEAGEVAHAVNKYEPAERIRDELLDVAAVAMRLYFGEIDTGLHLDGLVQRRTERARLDADRTAVPKTRIVSTVREGEGARAEGCAVPSGDTYVAEDGARIPLKALRIWVDGYAPGNETPNNRQVSLAREAVSGPRQTDSRSPGGAGTVAGGACAAATADARIGGEHRSGGTTGDVAHNSALGEGARLDAAEPPAVVTGLDGTTSTVSGRDLLRMHLVTAFGSVQEYILDAILRDFGPRAEERRDTIAACARLAAAEVKYWEHRGATGQYAAENIEAAIEKLAAKDGGK